MPACVWAFSSAFLSFLNASTSPPPLPYMTSIFPHAPIYPLTTGHAMKASPVLLLPVLAVLALLALVEAFHVRLPPPALRPPAEAAVIYSYSHPSSSSSLIFKPRKRTLIYNDPDDSGSSSRSREGTVMAETQQEEEEEESNLDSTGATLVMPSSTTGPTSAAASAVFQLWKRRLWTKADYLHSHAVSGTAFMVLGALYVLYFLCDELFAGAGLAHAENGVVGWVPLAIMWTGVINCISCLPMSKFRTGPSGGYDTKGAGFKGLGIGMTMLGIWTAYFFSGHYPTWMAPVDPVLAIGFLAVIIHGIVNSEVALAKELEEKAPAMTPEGVWKSPPSSSDETDPTAAAAAATAVAVERETRMEIILNHRVASYPNLLHLPVLYNIILGGQPWLQQLLLRFPLEPTLLFHASFGIAVANSIVFLGATLKDRRLMTLRQWLLLQVVVLTPFVTTVVDVGTLEGEVSINPFEVYAGLMG